MNFVNGIPWVLQIAHIVALRQFGYQFLEAAMVFLLKHLGILAVGCRSALAIFPVALHMVDEEQAEHFYLLRKQLSFPFEVGPDGFPNLYSPYQVFVHHSHSVAFVQHQSVEKPHCSCPSVDALYSVSVPIFLQAIALVVEVVAVLHQFQTLSCACGSPYVVAYPCLRVPLAQHDAVEIHKSVGGCRSHLTNASHLYFLHQLAVVGIDGIQTEHHVLYIVLSVGCAIQHLKQGIKLRYSLSCGIALVGTQHTLRLVDNHYRVVLGNHVDRPSPSEFLLLGEYYPCRRVATSSFLVFVLVHRGVEGLGVDYHHMYVAALREMVYHFEFLRVIDEILHALAIFLGKVVAHAAETFQHSFPDGDAWHHDDELQPAVKFVEFIHRLYVGIGFSRTCFHLHCQCPSVAFDPVDRLYALFHLRLAYVFAEVTVSY